MLERLSNAPEDILSDVPLIEGLEATKLAAREIELAVEAGKKTEKDINKARQVYVPVSVEGASESRCSAFSCILFLTPPLSCLSVQCCTS